ncbi:MAG: hypothetical protein MK135_06830 [Polyangiaceae bacterium]|nr:hypothetical protein [Polyangiaceae bacterium]
MASDSKNIDFFQLTRTLQDRFVESSRGAAAPAVLAWRPLKDFRPSAWFAVGGLTVLLWAGYTMHGFGDLGSSWALGGVAQLGGHVLFGALSGFCFLHACSLLWSSSRQAYASGIYLFPAALIIARRNILRTYLPAELTVSAGNGHLRVELKGGATYSLTIKDKRPATEVQAQYEQGARQWSTSQDALERARLHPLIDSGVPNPLAPTQPLREKRFAGFFVQAAVVLLFAIATGVTVSQIRNRRSEREIYRTAVELNTVDSYQTYLKRGGTRADVPELYLPRAELEVARAEGTVGAIEAFLERNAESRIIEEVRAAHRQALLEELNLAIAQGTVAAIDELPKRFRAASLIEPEMVAARHAIYVRAYESFRKQATDDQDVLEFAQQLLNFVEKKGPQVLLQIEQKFTQDPALLDKIVSKNRKYFLGTKSLPTQYFLGENARRREKALLESLQKRFQEAFPEELVRFELAPLPEKANEEIPAREVPTLTISHSDKLSGGYVGGRPKTLYLGASVTIRTRFLVPEQESAEFTTKWSSWRQPRFAPRKERSFPIPTVYEAMMAGAFDKFEAKYLRTWFKQEND